MADASGAAAAATPAAQLVPFGTIFVSGSVAHSMSGRKDPPVAYDGVPETNLWNFHVFSSLKDVKVKAVVSGPNACHYFAITTDGGVYAWGRNERGQLGNGSTTNVYVPALIAGVPRIAAVSAGKNHTLLLTEGGDVLAAGDNKMGQCSQGKNKVGDAPILKFTTVAGLPAGRTTAIAAGGDFSVAVADGKLYSAGSQEYGQCGTGTDGVWIVSAGRTAVQEVPAFEAIPVDKSGAAGVRFSAVAAGANHAVGLAVDGRVFTWGWGAYGRCGHGNTADVLVPTAVKFFDAERMRARSIVAGASITFVVTRTMNQVYFCGISKKSGEAAMVPKPFSDVCSLNPQAIAAGPTSTAMAFGGGNAGNGNQTPMLVSFGPSPTSGELGFGEATKSSTKPKEVDDLSGCRVLDIALGVATCLALVDTRPPPAPGTTVPSPADTGSPGGPPYVPGPNEANPAADIARGLIESGKVKVYTPVQPAAALAGKRPPPVEKEGAAAKAPAGKKAKK